VHVCQQFTAFACQGHASAQQITGRAHRSGVNRGLREHAPTQQPRNFARRCVVFSPSHRMACRRGH
jgi:hypothetical protein